MIFAPLRIRPAARLILAAFVMDLALAMVGLAVQYLGVYELHAPNLVLGLFGACANAGYTVGCLFSGWLSDRYGRRASVVTAAVGIGLLWGALPLLGSWGRVLAVLPLCGLVIAFFWPPLQAWLAEVSLGGQRELSRNLGLFNLMWVAGVMVGQVITGYLWRESFLLSFIASAVLAWLLAVWILRTPERLSRQPRQVAGGQAAGAMSPPSPGPDAVPPATTRGFLYLARLGNFGAGVAAGLVLAMFPKLGVQLGFGTILIGWLMFIFWFGQLGMFFWTRYEHRWQYRFWPLPLAEGAAALALILVFTARSPGLFAAAFFVIGVTAGLTYVSSLFYALHNRTANRGRSSGFHEAILGLGVLVGPLLGGAFGQWVSLRAGFLAAAVLLVLIAGVQLAWRRRLAAGNPCSRPDTAARSDNASLSPTTPIQE